MFKTRVSLDAVERQSGMTDESPNRPDREHGRGRVRLMRALFDTRFSGMLAAEMVPAIYRLGILVSALTAIACTLAAFRLSWLAGMAWALVLGPALFLAAVVTIRVLLEFVLAVFRMSSELRAVEHRLNEVVHELRRADATLHRVDDNVDALNRRITAIHEEFPRLAFWRRAPERHR